MLLENNVVLITGGCQGLGYEIAKILSPKNQVIICSNNKEKLEEAAKTLNCKSFYCDITNPEEIKNMVDDVENDFGKLDILINNAGVWIGCELDKCDYSDIAKVMFVNSVGTINVTKTIVPIMKKQKSGKILNVCSVDGLTLKPERSVYVSSKWAITGFTDSLREELKPYGISVMGIYPGLIKTNLFENAKTERNLESAMDSKEVAEIVKFALSFDDINFEKIVFRGMKE